MLYRLGLRGQVSKGMITAVYWESDVRAMEWSQRHRSGIKALYKPEDADKDAKKKQKEKTPSSRRKKGAKANEDEAEDDEGIPLPEELFLVSKRTGLSAYEVT